MVSIYIYIYSIDRKIDSLKQGRFFGATGRV